MKWYGKQFLAKIEIEEKRRMERAVRVVRNEVVSSLGIKVGKVGRTVVERSKPGETPRLETGELRRSIATEVVNENGIVGRVGTNKHYARPLSTSLDRDFLQRGLNATQAEVKRILTSKIE